MVGEARGPGRGDAGLRSGIRPAYEASAGRWAGGPERVYASLARALLDGAAAGLDGGVARRVLDAGAGTGTAGRAALAAGAREVVSADAAVAMLRRCGGTLHPVAADLTALPFADGCFDLVVAAFSLGHLDRPAAGLAEARRVAPKLAASAFAPGWSHPAKAAVEEVLASFGYRPPPWYLAFKRDTEPRASDPAAVRRDAAGAGYADVRLDVVEVATGADTPAELAGWRLGMAHVAPFVGSLPAGRQAELAEAAARAVASAGPLVVSMLVLTAG